MKRLAAAAFAGITLAAAVGLARDDVMVDVNGAPVAEPADLVAVVSRLHAGDHIVVRYIRGGASHDAAGTLAPRPYESAEDVDTLYDAVDAGGSLRRTVVTIPRADGRHPAVLYLTGIGCFSQEDASMQSTESKLLYGLSRGGFVLVLMPTMDHFMGHVETMEASLAKTSGPFGPFEPAVLDVVRDWLERQAG